jgi:hypothetical protein
MRITSGGNVGIGASTNPQNLLEVSAAGGSNRIRVGTLQNNNNVSYFEAITSSGTTTATSGWLRANYGGGLTLGLSSYTKTGGDSGNFANISAESQNPVLNITSGGNVLIGASAGSGNNESVGIVSNSTQSFRINNTHNTSGDVNFVSIMGTNTFNTSSIHYIAYSAGSQAISIYGNGNIQNANNSYGALSDIKLKENIVDASPKLEDLLKVKIRNYNLIGNETKQIGVVAQELEEIFPSMIEEDKDGIKGVKYSVFVPMLIKALQEQQQTIQDLTNRLINLENK